METLHQFLNRISSIKSFLVLSVIYLLFPANVATELQSILPEGTKRTQQLEGYRQVKAILGEKGASERAGRLMVAYLQKQ